MCASSDGQVSVVEVKGEGKYDSVIFPAHDTGVNAVSWAPPSVSESIVHTTNSQQPKSQESRRFVSGGSDNLVKVWKHDSESGKYLLEDTLEGHSDWIRDVAWSPSVLSKSYIASASQDKSVIIWTQEGAGPWTKKHLKGENFPDTVWRVSWSLSGNVLAVTGGDNQVTLWKENLDGEWETAGKMQE